MDRALLERMVGAAALVLLLVVFAPALLDGTGEPGSEKLVKDSDERDVRTQVIVLNEPKFAAADDTPATDIDTGPPKIIVPERPAPVAGAASVNQPSEAEAGSSAAPEPKAAMAAQASASAPAPAKVPVPSPAPATAPAPVKPPAAAPAPVATPKPPQPVSTAKTPSETLARPTVEKATKPTVADSKAGATATGFAVQLGSFSQAENAQKYAAQLTDRGFAVFVRSSGSAASSMHRVFAGPRPDRQAAEKLAAVLGSAGYKGIVVDLSGSSGSVSR